jgi:hypothetical protein
VDLEKEYKMIVKWGQTVRPAIQEQLKPPPAEIEDDVQKL